MWLPATRTCAMTQWQLGYNHYVWTSISPDKSPAHDFFPKIFMVISSPPGCFPLFLVVSQDFPVVLALGEAWAPPLWRCWRCVVGLSPGWTNCPGTMRLGRCGPCWLPWSSPFLLNIAPNCTMLHHVCFGNRFDTEKEITCVPKQVRIWSTHQTNTWLKDVKGVDCITQIEIQVIHNKSFFFWNLNTNPWKSVVTAFGVLNFEEKGEGFLPNSWPLFTGQLLCLMCGNIPVSSDEFFPPWESSSNHFNGQKTLSLWRQSRI